MRVEEICVLEAENLIGAMEKLDTLATKILFVVREGKLVGTLTDGDIRRWILKKGGLDATVDKIANYNPIYLKADTQEDIFAYLAERKIEAIPLVNEDLTIDRVVFWSDKDLDVKKPQLNMPVVMMAGGKGTRLYPYTKILPKPLIPVGEVPIAQRIIEHYREYGCKDFHLIVNHKKNMIKAYFNEIDKDYNIFYEDEDIPLGTGGGLGLLKGKIDETFIMTNCDILIREDFSKIVKLHKESENMITMVCSLKNFRIPYGVVDIAQDGQIEAMREKPELSFFTNTGCYIVEPEVIEDIKENERIDFPTIITNYQKAGKKVGVYPISENSWLDMGQMDELERMRSMLEGE